MRRMNRQCLAFSRAASAFIGSRRGICFGSAIIHAAAKALYYCSKENIE
jgi:hypothetical protein